MLASRRLALIAALAMCVAGCSGQSHDNNRTPAKTGAAVSGSVSYRERMALPADAVVTVSLVDVAPPASSNPIVTETTIRTTGRQVPILFELAYDPTRIDADRAYVVKAMIRSGDQVLFATATETPVITQGNPSRVDLWLSRPAPAETPGASTMPDAPSTPDVPGAPVAPTMPGTSSTGLVGTSWHVEHLPGADLQASTMTLEFPEAGRVAGRGACNRFFGAAELGDATIHFGAIGATRMACSEAIMNLEQKYFDALQAAERYEREGNGLRIYARGFSEPIRFVPAPR